jgi:hypothetical protein
LAQHPASLRSHEVCLRLPSDLWVDEAPAAQRGSSTRVRVYMRVCVCVCVCARARARVRVYKEHGSSTWIFDAGTRPLNKCVLKWALICALIRALTCALNVYLNVCRGGYVDTEAKELVS